MTPEELGRALRTDAGESMKRRRQIASLSLFNILSMGVLALYQLGITKRVPLEPPLPGFDAEKVNGSAQAYEILRTPDAVLGLGSYAATLGLAAIGGPDRAQTMPWAPVLLAVKATGDAALAVKLLIDQPTRYRAFSSWSVLAAAAALAVVGLSLREAGDAIRRE